MAKNGVFCNEVHVLAVDDSLVDLKVIERLLEITSFKVTAVDSGRRALQILGLDDEEEESSVDDLKVDLVITDYCMPGMSGYELLKKIKGSSTFRELPVVMMSSENILTRIHRCLEEGAQDFIVKPVKLSDVKRLKSYMFGETHFNRRQDHPNLNKKILHETCDDDFSSSPSSDDKPPSSLDSPLSRLSASSRDHINPDNTMF